LRNVILFHLFCVFETVFWFNLVFFPKIVVYDSCLKA